MVLEKEIVPLLDWLLPGALGWGALLKFVATMAGLAFLSLFIAYLRMAIRLGPGEGFYAVAKAVAVALGVDLPNTAVRRIWAVARLAIQEALRRRVLVGFAIFAVLLLFAGWFLDTKSDHPARLYLSFVLTATERLILVLAVLISAFSLPNDIKSKTIYTVVTKPVRAGEIVFGRVVGFVAVNTAILVLMGAVSYGFVLRGLRHTHAVTADDAEAVKDPAGTLQAWKGETGYESHHRHEFTVSAAERHAQTERMMDHYHEIEAVGDGESLAFQVGPARGALVARVPQYGKLRFYDRTGRPGVGISVGKEWTYRQYIEGGSLAAAAWRFTGIRPEDYPADHLPLEMTTSIFRTYKGNIEVGIAGTITVKNPSSGMSSEPLPFTAKEFVVYQHQVPRQLKALGADGTLQDIDLYRDLVDQEGQLEIWIQCAEPSQYFGMAQPDLYIGGHDASFFANFCKAFVGIWLQMVIVTCFGVTLSTFLSGPVAMFATFIAYMIGLFKDFIIGVASGEILGGGPIEAFLRLITQKNVMIELDMGPVVDRVVQWSDRVLMYFLWVAANIFPDYKSFNTSKFVAYGFNIDGNLLGQHCLITLGFVVVLSVYGYFFLKSREIAG